MAIKRNTRRKIGLWFLIIFTALLCVVALPREDIILKKIGIKNPLKIRRGLDLQGGAYLVYEADMSQLEKDANQGEVLKNASAVIERRVNPGGTGEVTVRTANGNRVVVELPGVDSPDQANQLIGRTAQLSFFEVSQAAAQGQDTSGGGVVPTNVSGKDVRRASVDFQQGATEPIVNLEFKGGEATNKFAELTTRLSQNGNQLVILLDNEIVFGPGSVQDPITTGKGQLSGSFTVKQADEIATLLNAGALPVPVKLVAQQTVGPTLGSLSIKQSILAAAIGLLGVSLFLLMYYRRAGVVAVISLVFYSLLMFVLIKLSVFTPYVIVLSLAGIAGFILSIAVAVDTNILIFERMKEELKRGATRQSAYEAGFTHAWTSIRDANAATIISCIVLYLFGTPVIKGFAITLGLGVVLNLITALTATKVLMRIMVRSKWSSATDWIGKIGKAQT